MSALPWERKRAEQANGTTPAPTRQPRRIERPSKQVYVLYRQIDNQQWTCIGGGILTDVSAYIREHNTVAWLRTPSGALVQFQPAIRWRCVPVPMIGGK